MTNVDAALLASEWSVGDWNVCPTCGRESPDVPMGEWPPKGGEVIICAPEPEPHGHKPNCAMDLALAERGYPTQVERNAARARLKAANEPTLPPPASGAR